MKMLFRMLSRVSIYSDRQNTPYPVYTSSQWLKTQKRKNIAQRYSQTFNRHSTKYGTKGLTNRQFIVKYLEAITTTFPVEAGIPQGRVLGPLLFSIYTADLPILTQITIVTFADDTALLTSHADPIIPSSTLQRCLDAMEKRFHKWGFKINENKSTHVTFTLQKQTCPQVNINNITIPNKD